MPVSPPTFLTSNLSGYITMSALGLGDRVDMRAGDDARR